MHTGIAIALAWPETFCKQAGSWYDGIMNVLGFSKDNYYKVGHAAVVLINNATGECDYFDFGRYHAPFGHGRVRDKETDHELIINTIAQISPSGEIENYENILDELSNNPACHGTGIIHSSYCKVNFKEAFSVAKQMQEKSPWKYGPFIWDGTNCSRFVRTIVLAGSPPLTNTLRIFFPFSISPTPTGNVKSLKNKKQYLSANKKLTFFSSEKHQACQVIIN